MGITDFSSDNPVQDAQYMNREQMSDFIQVYGGDDTTQTKEDDY